MSESNLIDPFGRTINYLRISVTDRCDFRCTYCMAEEMVFTPRKNLLTLEELEFIGHTFMDLGVNKIRITGGEPLIRRNVTQLLKNLSTHPNLNDLAITTNGSHLHALGKDLHQAGIKRLNVSLDTLDSIAFSRITRTGKLETVLQGLETSSALPFKKIKINSVILKGQNDDQIIPLVEYAISNGFDISFIEEMPLGEINSHNRADAFMPSNEIKNIISEYYTLLADSLQTGGPSRYWKVSGSEGKNINKQVCHIGFISPHSHNFCGDCNRVRLTAEGRLLMCLGNEHSIDLRAIVRENPNNKDILTEAIIKGLALKPKEHHFDLNAQPDIIRFMNATGG